MHICVLGSWRESVGETNRTIAEVLREMGHVVTPLPSVSGMALKFSHPVLAGLAQKRLERVLFQYDAVVVNGSTLDYVRVAQAMHNRPTIIWAQGDCAFENASLKLSNVTFICCCEGQMQQANQSGFEAVAIEPFKGKPPREEIRQRLENLLTEEAA